MSKKTTSIIESKIDLLNRLKVTRDNPELQKQLESDIDNFNYGIKPKTDEKNGSKITQ